MMNARASLRAYDAVATAGAAKPDRGEDPRKAWLDRNGTLAGWD